MVSWIRAQGKRNNMVIVIRRSDAGGVRGKRAWIKFACERNGQYEPNRSRKSSKSDSGDQTSDAASRKQPVSDDSKDTRSKKCGCPFSLKAVNTGCGDQWELEVACGVHNHVVSEYIEGHSFAGRLTEEENSLLVALSKTLVKPKDILKTIKSQNPQNTSIIKTVYNARQKHRVIERAGRSEMQVLLTKLREHNYVEWHRSSGDVVTDLFWTHPESVDILRAFPHVLIMDCTYKTNRYRWPLFEIVGVTSTSMTFSVAFAYICSEKEDNYTWALGRVRSLLNDDCLPNVIVTDRELALMSAIPKVFPSARHLLCRWHISKNVLKNCRKLFGTVDHWEKFNGAWNCLVGSESEDEYVSRLRDMETNFCSYAGAIEYIKDSWLIPYKERFVAAWTDACMHLGNTTSNR